jgi:thiamine pyrophosphokinase
VIGDLDSLPDTALEHLQQAETELVPSPPEKDEIDLELALLYAVEMGAKEIVVVGGLGGRFDMSMANISLLAHPRFNDAAIEFWHDEQKIWLIRPPGDEIEGKVGDTLSLLPFAGEATGVQTTNLAYPLQHESLPFGPARGVSNVLTTELASVSLESGALLAVHTQVRA